MRLKEKIQAAVIVLVIALLLVPGLSHALTLKQKALVGLKGMDVLVEKMNPQAERLGLGEGQIKTDVELRLRKAGVRVLTEKESLETPEMPALYVNITTVFKSNICAYSIHVSLSERVTLASGFQTTGFIWDIGEIGFIGPENISKIRGYVGGQVDRFINDYLAANPK
jgi:hypothetical protein